MPSHGSDDLMRRLGCLILVLAVLGVAEAEPELPLASGEHHFEMKDVEFPSMPGTPVRVGVDGRHIKVVSESRDSTVFPLGTTVDEGMIIWHAATGQWIIGESESDATAATVGGCSDGPAVIDVVGKVYWFC